MIVSNSEIIITANWVKDLFPVVEDIVRRAPNIPGWTITAFRQRGLVPDNVEIEGVTYEMERFFFVPYTDGFELDVQVCIPGYEEETERAAASSMINLLLGEYDSLIKVRRYYFDTIEGMDEDDLYPLSELPAVVDHFTNRTAH